ncbi:hypothetical protein PMI08_03693, partial [Brevibacillus sp. CF112]
MIPGITTSPSSASFTFKLSILQKS